MKYIYMVVYFDPGRCAVLRRMFTSEEVAKEFLFKKSLYKNSGWIERYELLDKMPEYE